MRARVHLVAVLAAASCGLALIATGAAAAPRGHAAPGTSAPPGQRCTTVHSNVHGRTGSICVYVEHAGARLRADVTFTGRSGTLRGASVGTLELLVGHQVVQKLHNVAEYVNGAGGRFAKNWWDGEGMAPEVPVQAGIYNACLAWSDGGRACTGPHWFYSQAVRGL